MRDAGFSKQYELVVVAVVSYQSAHIPEVKSELVVRSGHSVQANPHTVAEVRRILLLHLEEACPHGCTPATGNVAGLQR